MKIGIFAARQFPYISANTSIAYTVGDELYKLGHSVTYIGMRDSYDQDKTASYHNSKICFLNKNVPKQYPVISRLWNHLRKYISDCLFFKKKISALRHHIRQESLDVLICIIAPEDNAIIASYCTDLLPVCLYQLDPFYQRNDQIDMRKYHLFLDIQHKFHHIFTTDLLYQE